jgi:hypothetical protein
MKGCRWLVSCAILALVSGLTVFAQEEVKIESGSLRGASQDGVVSFKGIPFATAPTGSLRWSRHSPWHPGPEFAPRLSLGTTACRLRGSPKAIASLAPPAKTASS